MSKSRNAIQWLLKELPELKKTQIIDHENAEALKNYYLPKLTPGMSFQKVMLIFFSILSAALIGGGVILIVAHNWDELPKTFRVVMAFLPLLAGLYCGGYTLLKNKDTRWKETSAILIASGCATAIAIISQIYHLGGTLHDFMFTWMLLIFILIYIFDSASVVFIYLYAFSTYNGWRWDIEHNIYYIIMFALLVLPYLIYNFKRFSDCGKTALFSWLIMTFALINFPMVFYRCSEYELCIAWSILLASFYLIGMDLRERGIGAWANPYLLTGFIGMLIFIAIGSFPDTFWSSWYSRFEHKNNTYLLLFFIMALLTVYDVIVIIRRKIPPVFVVVVILPLLVVLSAWLDKYTMAYLFSGYMFVLGATLLVSGYKKRELFKLNLGMLIISLLIILRFLDSHLNILGRGLVFIAVGVAFLLANVFIGKKFKQTAVPVASEVK